MKISKKKYEIALARKQLSQKQLCDIAGLSSSTIRKIGVENVTPCTAGRLAAALNVDIEEIMENE